MGHGRSTGTLIYCYTPLATNISLYARIVWVMVLDALILPLFHARLDVLYVSAMGTKRGSDAH